MVPASSLGKVTHPRLHGVYYLGHVGSQFRTVGVLARTEKGLVTTTRRMVEEDWHEEHGFGHEEGVARRIRVVNLGTRDLRILVDAHRETEDDIIRSTVLQNLMNYHQVHKRLPAGWREIEAVRVDGSHAIHGYKKDGWFQWQGQQSIVETFRAKVPVEYEENPKEAWFPFAEAATGDAPVMAYYGGYRARDSYRDVAPWEVEISGDMGGESPLGMAPTFYFQVETKLPKLLGPVIKKARGTDKQRAKKREEWEASYEKRREKERLQRDLDLDAFFVIDGMSISP